MAILLYDGSCGLCHGAVRFLLRRDRARNLRFAPLAGGAARDILRRHGRDPGRLDTIYLVLDPGGPRERLLDKSRAILAALARLHLGWRLVALARFLPAKLLDVFYDGIARRRYRWFGRIDQSPLPAPEERARFLD